MQQNLEQIYQQLPESLQLQTISYDFDLKIMNELDKEKKQFQYPTVTKDCRHPKECFELDLIMKEIGANGVFKCQFCKAVATQEDLVKDLRYRVQMEFNEFVTNIMIIEGKLFNKSNRRKRFLDPFSKNEVRILFKQLFDRYIEKEASINQLLIQELKSNTSQKSGVKQRYEFWAFCLQDKVKITIPVRIIGCKHLECYELTSLLLLLQEQHEPFYCCNYPGCENPHKKIDITSFHSLFSKIMIDLDLLQLIKISNPYSMKFVFNYQTQKFVEDVTSQNGKIIDPTIETYYKKYIQNPQIKFEEFQQQVFQQLAQVCQNDLFKDQQQQQLQQLEKDLKYQKYRNFEVNMKDQLTEMIIEQPVRCKNCKDFSKCLDLKSYCCEFIKIKITGSHADSFTCPLCKIKYQSKIVQCSLQNYIYLDQNLLSRIFKDLSYRTYFQFKYLGRDYMIQEFCERSKLSKQDYINDLKKKNQKLNIEFKSILCSLNKEQQLQIPLVLDQCPQKIVIDFSTFYDKLVKCDFKIDQGLILCKCTECNTKPIKQISGTIFYHEAFDHALKQFYKTKSTQKSFSYDFENDKLTVSQAITDTQALKNVVVNKKRGFLDMLNDEEYQSVFGVKNLDGKIFQILQIEQQVCEGLLIKQNAQGQEGNLTQKKDQMNENAQKNEQLKKWGFKIQSIEVQLNNDQIVTNKGVLKG